MNPVRAGGEAPAAFPRDALGGSAVAAARALLGARLVRRGADGSMRVGRIVEVEAYGGPQDRASHARAGPTARTSVMFGPPGHAYVYLVYGMHHCLNVVSGPPGAAGAVLVRAAEALEGQAAMVAARDVPAARRGPPARPPRRALIASGPGRLCAAFSIDRTLDRTDLCDPNGPLFLAPAAPDDRPPVVAWGPRIGIGYAGEPWSGLRWRLVDRSSVALSAPVEGDAAEQADETPGPGLGG
ncbi:MAG: DNA-3-methyladenine glycosylase [Chloroflexi bacterium]|nr:DNA-3-methyladenine glycosylase [Chloroflexota bacterium]